MRHPSRIVVHSVGRPADRARFAEPSKSAGSSRRLSRSDPDYIDVAQVGWLLTNTERKVAGRRNRGSHWEKIAQDLSLSVKRVQQIHRSAQKKFATDIAPPTAATKKRPGYTYFIQSGDHIKIGYAIDVAARMSHLQIGNPAKLKLLGAIPANPSDERALHRRFDSDRIQGEWFRSTPKLLSFIEEGKL